MNGVLRSNPGRSWSRWAFVPAYFVCLASLIAMVSAAAVQLGLSLARHPGGMRPVTVASQTAQHVVKPSVSIPAAAILEARASSMSMTNDEWAEKLRDPAFWAARRNDKNKAPWSAGSNSGRSGLTRAEPDTRLRDGSAFAAPSGQWKSSGGDGDAARGEKTFRTVCVRLCDGYYWPISFATTEDNFERDEASCARSCDGPVKLYTYRNPGAEIEDMEDLKGHPYKRLTTAFQFRTTYEPSCKCKAHPWEQEAKDKHRLYALEAQRVKAAKLASPELVSEIKDLKTKIGSATEMARVTAKGVKADIEADTAGKSRNNRRAASKSQDRSGIDTASVEPSARPSLPAGDGVVIMRLGTRPPVQVRVETPAQRRAVKETVPDWRRAALKLD
jgi:hypothetical protein